MLERGDRATYTDTMGDEWPCLVVRACGMRGVAMISLDERPAIDWLDLQCVRLDALRPRRKARKGA